MRSWLGVALLCALGCGGQQSSGAAEVAGDVDSPPSFLCLPSLGELDQYSETMREGIAISRQALEIPRPPPPPSTDIQTMNRWSGSQLQEWITHKARVIQEARAELDRAAEESHEQRIIAGAIVGVLYEDIARVIIATPVPREIADDPELVRLYHETIVGTAGPTLDTARRAYRACNLNAGERRAYARWQTFCEGRGERLPGDQDEAALASGETSVEVIRE